MVELVRDFAARVKQLRRDIRALSTERVRRKSHREEARAIVDFYFRNLREQATIAGASADLIAGVDTTMHKMLEATHKRSTKNSYDSLLKSLTKQLLSIEKAVLEGPSVPTGPTFEAIDKRIVETLARILPSAARAYEQALRDLAGPERLSWRGPATDLRESLREVLDHLAPDEHVMAESNFKLEKEQTRPTMRQKVRFILKKRGLSASASKSPEGAAEAVDEIVGGFVRSVYTRSAISAHTPTDRAEVLRVHTYVRAALCELLEVHEV